MTNLDELSRLLEQATPGPWRIETKCPGECCWTLHDSGEEGWMIAQGEMSQSDAALIAALRNSAEELIRDARRWREAEELGRYGNDDGTRDWVTAGTWLYPGDRIVVVRDGTAQETAP